jgi:hypothetical protein
MTDEEYLPLVVGHLKVFQPPKDEGVQVSSFRTFGAIVSRLDNSMDEYADNANKFLYHARFVRCYHMLLMPLKLVWSSCILLHTASENLLRVVDDLEENTLFINLILAVFTQLTDRSTVCLHNLHPSGH